MHPTLIELSFLGRALAIDAHGLFITLGAIAGLIVMVRLARHFEVSTSDARELGLELVLAGALGAQLSRWGQLRLGSFAGLAAALAWLWWRAPQRGLQPERIADLAAPGTALAWAFGRIGCFLGGCCFGRPTAESLGVRFPPESVAFQALFERGVLPLSASATPPLHALQLYSAGAHLLLFFVLLWLARRPPARAGWLVGVLIVGHALIRLALMPLADAGR